MVYFNPPNHPVDGDETMILTIASGKHEDEPLTAVPTANLRWLLTVKLSPGLAEAVRMELARRGIAPLGLTAALHAQAASRETT
jgi:hypothetical protein